MMEEKYSAYNTSITAGHSHGLADIPSEQHYHDVDVFGREEDHDVGRHFIDYLPHISVHFPCSKRMIKWCSERLLAMLPNTQLTNGCS